MNYVETVHLSEAQVQEYRTLDVARTAHALRQAAEYLEAGDSANAEKLAKDALARIVVHARS